MDLTASIIAFNVTVTPVENPVFTRATPINIYINVYSACDPSAIFLWLL